jgi:hypothetical protein
LVAYEQRQAEAKAVSAAKAKDSYTELAKSMKDSGVSGIGVQPSGKSISERKSGFVGYSAAGMVGALQAADARAAKILRNNGSAVTTSGNAKNFPSNVKKAAELSGKSGSYWDRIVSNTKYGSLNGLSTNPLPTKPGSKTATYVSQALKANAPFSLSNAGKAVKVGGLIGAFVDPAMGAWNGYAQTPAKASVNEKATNAIMGGLKKVDNVAVSGGAGFLAGAATGLSGPGAVAVGFTGGVLAGEFYTRKGYDAKVDTQIEKLRPAVSVTVDATMETLNSPMANSPMARSMGLTGFATVFSYNLAKAILK